MQDRCIHELIARLRASGATVDTTFARNDAAFQNLTGSVLHPNSGPML